MKLPLLQQWVTSWESGLQAYDDGTGKPITPSTVLKGKPHIGIGFDLASPSADAIIRSLGLDYTAIRNGSAKITLIQAQQVLARTLQTAIAGGRRLVPPLDRSEEHTSEIQSLRHLVCRL